ncbi:MAG: hypothetical protein ACOVNL_06000 [Prochlorococcaceae cyanobacterium]
MSSSPEGAPRAATAVRPASPESPGASPVPASTPASAPVTAAVPADPVLCGHCGRTASNGISCQGYCVADSGY